MLFYVLFVLYRSVYCVCVNVYCTNATAWLPNWGQQIYHIISNHSNSSAASSLLTGYFIVENTSGIAVRIYCLMFSGEADSLNCELIFALTISSELKKYEIMQHCGKDILPCKQKNLFSVRNVHLGIIYTLIVCNSV